MAPKQGAKRGRPSKGGAQAPPPAKKVREDPNMAGVREALQRAEISDAVRQMLLSCLPNSLGVPAAERHESQVTVIQMIKEVMDAVTSKLQDALEEEKAKAAGAEEEKARLEGALSKVEATLAQVEEAVTAKDAALAEAATQVTAAKETLFERQEAQKSADGAFLEAKEKEAAVKKALAEDYQSIVDGTASAYTSILSLLEDVTLDASLLSALPKTCVKPLAERGAFDTMVLDQLKSLLIGKASSLEKTIKDAEPAAAEREAAITSAQAELDKATAENTRAAQELAEINKQCSDAQATVQEAKKASKDYAPAFAEATKVRDEKLNDLENWTGYNVACFEVLNA